MASNGLTPEGAAMATRVILEATTLVDVCYRDGAVDTYEVQPGSELRFDVRRVGTISHVNFVDQNGITLFKQDFAGYDVGPNDTFQVDLDGQRRIPGAGGRSPVMLQERVVEVLAEMQNLEAELDR